MTPNMSFAFVPSAGKGLHHVFTPSCVSTMPLYRSPCTLIARRARVHSPSSGPSFTPRMTKGEVSGGRPSNKELAKLYGGSYIGTSIGLSLISYFVLYFMIAAGVDVRSLVNAFGDFLATTPVGRPGVLDNFSDTASTATLAYIAHKATSPLRFPLTVAATPVVAKAFAKKDDKSEADSS